MKFSSNLEKLCDKRHSACQIHVKKMSASLYKTRRTSPCTVNVDVDSSRSIDVTPDIRRACIMFAPWVPIDSPIKSLLTRNSSWNDDPRGAYDVRELWSDTDTIQVTEDIKHKIDVFSDVRPSQSLALVMRELDLTWDKQMQEQIGLG